jgi:hypothetical protein
MIITDPRITGRVPRWSEVMAQHRRRTEGQHQRSAPGPLPGHRVESYHRRHATPDPRCVLCPLPSFHVMSGSGRIDRLPDQGDRSWDR